MTIRARMIAGTALALVMATATAATATASVQTRTLAPAEAGHAHSHNTAPDLMLLAQAEGEELSEEERRRLRQEAEPEQEQQAPAEEQPAPERQVEQPAPEPEAPPAPEPQPEAPPAPEPVPEAPPAPEPQPEQPAPEQPPRAVEEPTPEQAPVPEEQPAQPTPEQAPAPEETPAPAPEAPPAPAEEQPAPPEQAPTPPEQAPTPPEQAPVPQEAPAEQPARETQPPAAEQPPAAAPAPAPGEQPAREVQQPAEAVPVEPETGTPILDSQKEGEGQAERPAREARQPAPPAEAAPPPASDAAAQQLEAPVEVQSLRQEEGRRIERSEERRERREGTDVLREIGDRVILQFNNQTIVRSDDRGRLERDASEVYYEELPRGRTREVVVRPNGVEVVTIRDRYGDVIRRSRITPDGREYVLVYGDDREERRQWRDPGLDMPPLRLAIPVEDYILDARRVQQPDDYYEFLEQPPVEPVRRLYSIDEVKYSARVRDTVRRIDLDTITFDFGAATISESEITRLEGVATAMERLLDENPAETFLIEGHTDAVGSDEANLALSDRRAESVAAALTNVFGIPPENLVTQGYGERYLKLNTQEPERANRRVAMRRITPLVTPVADAR